MENIENFVVLGTEISKTNHIVNELKKVNTVSLILYRWNDIPLNKRDNCISDFNNVKNKSVNINEALRNVVYKLNALYLDVECKSLKKLVLDNYDLHEIISKNENNNMIIIHIYETFTLSGNRVWTIKSINKHSNIEVIPEHMVCNTVITSNIMDKFISEIYNNEKHEKVQWNNTFSLAIVDGDIVAELAECIRKDFNNETFN